MPSVLQEHSTGELFACMQVNHYDLGYFGVKSWASEAEAEAGLAQLLEQEALAGEWRVIEIEEGMLKRSNVKLKNDPAYKILLVNGALQAERRSSS